MQDRQATKYVLMPHYYSSNFWKDQQPIKNDIHKEIKNKSNSGNAFTTIQCTVLCLKSLYQ